MVRRATVERKMKIGDQEFLVEHVMFDVNQEYVHARYGEPDRGWHDVCNCGKQHRWSKQKTKPFVVGAKIETWFDYDICGEWSEFSKWVCRGCGVDVTPKWITKDTNIPTLHFTELNGRAIDHDGSFLEWVQKVMRNKAVFDLEIDLQGGIIKGHKCFLMVATHEEMPGCSFFDFKIYCEKAKMTPK